MDVSLPGMDGKEATQRAAGDPRFASLPIIAVTARATKEEEKAIAASGVHAMGRKPIDENHLLCAINSFLSQEINHGQNTDR